jgi:tetratricopeptide (TPR) repeat protein
MRTNRRHFAAVDILSSSTETADMSSTSSAAVDAAAWAGRRVAIVGRLAGLTKREALRLLKRHGAVPVDDLGPGVDVVVVGEYDLPPPDLAERLEATAGEQKPAARVVSETDLWRELGVAESQQQAHRVYTPAMLADLLGVSPAVVRGWQRRGLIHPVRVVHRLPYFDYQEVASARRLAQMLAAGASAKKIESQLSALRRLLPNVERPLAQLSIIVDGRALLLRQEAGLVDPGGQYRLDFDAADADVPVTVALASAAPPSPGCEPADASPEALRDAAVQCDESGRLAEAADLYRAALAASGPHAETCFQLADVLYRLGDLGAARERYLMAVEIDEDYVEARSNVGCILAEEGRLELAVAAFEGALRYHDDYPDVHYHLAQTLDDLGRAAEAELHWRMFLDSVPESPWAENARRRLRLPAAEVRTDEEGDDAPSA